MTHPNGDSASFGQSLILGHPTYWAVEKMIVKKPLSDPNDGLPLNSPAKITKEMWLAL